jgi:hypothetical protein
MFCIGIRYHPRAVHTDASLIVQPDLAQLARLLQLLLPILDSR